MTKLGFRASVPEKSEIWGICRRVSILTDLYRIVLYREDKLNCFRLFPLAV